MSFELLTVGFAGALIAYFNGANDVSKGIATLVGSGLTNYRRAILWGTVCTGLGGLSGALLAAAMVQTFGKGLLANGTVPTFAAALATILGASTCVAIATRTGMPVFTTHAIVGSLAGVAAIAYGLHGIKWSALMAKIALPLLLSPILALPLTLAAIRAMRLIQSRFSSEADCACATVELSPVSIGIAMDGSASTLSLPSFGIKEQERMCLGSVGLRGNQRPPPALVHERSHQLRPRNERCSKDGRYCPRRGDAARQLSHSPRLFCIRLSGHGCRELVGRKASNNSAGGENHAHGPLGRIPRKCCYCCVGDAWRGAWTSYVNDSRVIGLDYGNRAAKQERNQLANGCAK